MPIKKPKSKPKTYAEHRDFWYKKLADSTDFVDIEDKEGRLKETSAKFNRQDARRNWHAKTEYYSMANQFLNNYKFKSRRERIIWEYHANGLSVRDISVIFKHAKLKPISKTHVWHILKPLILEMKSLYLVGDK